MPLRRFHIFDFAKCDYVSEVFCSFEQAIELTFGGLYMIVDSVDNTGWIAA